MGALRLPWRVDGRFMAGLTRVPEIEDADGNLVCFFPKSRVTAREDALALVHAVNGSPSPEAPPLTPVPRAVEPGEAAADKEPGVLVTATSLPFVAPSTEAAQGKLF